MWHFVWLVCFVQRRGAHAGSAAAALSASVPCVAPVFPRFNSRQEKGAERRVLLVCTHRAPASTGTAASTVLPCVRPLLPAAVTSDPYYFCKVEQGRKNGCAVSFFMRQDLLRTIGEINPSM